MIEIEASLHNTALFYTLVTLVSLLVGSFLNVVIHRLPVMMERAWQDGVRQYLSEHQSSISNQASTQADAELQFQSGETTPGSGDNDLSPNAVYNLAVPRSQCPACGVTVKAWQNIPVLSYLLLKGKCGNCESPISIRYPLIELLTMVMSIAVAWHLGPTPQALLGIVVTWFLITMSVIDIDHQLLPDSLTLPLMWIGMLAALIPLFADLPSAVIGAAAGYLALWTVYQLFKLITGKEGMGYGDFKLLAALGALLGWQALPVIILLSSLVGAVVGLSLILVTGRDKNIPIPFGPYLAAAGWIAMLWGDDLSDWYLGVLA